MFNYPVRLYTRPQLCHSYRNEQVLPSKNIAPNRLDMQNDFDQDHDKSSVWKARICKMNLPSISLPMGAFQSSFILHPAVTTFQSRLVLFCVSLHKKADLKRILCGKLTYELCKTPPSLCLNALIWNRRFSCFSQCIIAVWGQFVSNRCRSSCCGNRHDDHDAAEPWLIMDFRYVDGIMLPERHTPKYLHSGLQACALHLHRSSGINHSK